MHSTHTYEDIEQELCNLTRYYEARGFKHHFYLENGSLVCSKYDLVLTDPDISVYENRYYPKRMGIPHGFCLFAITVSKTPCVLKGLFLLPQGLLTQQQISREVVCQLQLQQYPQLFKADENHHAF
ncbi:hypothetical protein HHL17_27830 [Chitinophaga sp. G-6-1-13]|uniref:Uncharacterized protein n=1 Tax=Chitinophaga fulva TaxID=2728842 RepID=A0A848GR53_9BACT|nr:hypothetical protein [Chitinophaga fulva]NML41036.1 hypothetical protein [Chitinophaga fulva]